MATLRVVENRLPEYIAAFEAKAYRAEREAAQGIQYFWSADVRVSPGAGNYDGRAGGIQAPQSHYRDNIFVMRLVEEEDGVTGWSIYTPVWYAEFNEFGGGPLTPRPSAEMAAEQGIDQIAWEFRSEFGQ